MSGLVLGDSARDLQKLSNLRVKFSGTQHHLLKTTIRLNQGERSLAGVVQW